MDAVAGRLLNLVYLALLTFVAPVLAYRALRHGKYREGLSEKLLGTGATRSTPGPAIWLHAVSVGEVLLLKPVVENLRQHRPDADIWLSTTTHTGQAVARRTYPQCRVIYFPLDFTWSVGAALDRVRPDVIGLAELELWPNFISTAADRDIPVVLLNGRISEKSFRGYRRIRFLMRRVLSRISAFGVQTPEYARRMIELGAPPDRVAVTGSVKFDGVRLQQDPARIDALRLDLGIGPGERVLLAGSTHAPEEQIVLQCYDRLQREFPDLRLLVAPRHQERFAEAASLITAAGWPLRRRSEAARQAGPAPRPSGSDVQRMQQPHRPEIVLLDTLGELSTCWELAELAFVGGSLSNRGGQNMLEPCAAGAAVVVGPNTWNFQHAVELLVAAGGLLAVRDADELYQTLRQLITDQAQADRLRTAARRAIDSQQGATQQTVDLLLNALSTGVVPSRVAA